MLHITNANQRAKESRQQYQKSTSTLWWSLAEETKPFSHGITSCTMTIPRQSGPFFAPVPGFLSRAPNYSDLPSPLNYRNGFSNHSPTRKCHCKHAKLRAHQTHEAWHCYQMQNITSSNFSNDKPCVCKELTLQDTMPAIQMLSLPLIFLKLD